MRADEAGAAHDAPVKAYSARDDIPGLPPFDPEMVDVEPSGFDLIWDLVRSIFGRAFNQWDIQDYPQRLNDAQHLPTPHRRHAVHQPAQRGLLPDDALGHVGQSRTSAAATSRSW